MKEHMTHILQRAPVWIWPLFLFLLLGGLRMTRTRSMPPLPVIIISSAMLCLSCFGVLSAFQGSALALLAWAGMLAAVLLTCQKLGYPQGWQFDATTRRIHVPGSWLPLALFMSIFLIKFSVSALLAMHPAYAQNLSFSLMVSAVYGALSGIFAARSWHALRISRKSRLATAQ
jgi:hypothetical protein